MDLLYVVLTDHQPDYVIMFAMMLRSIRRYTAAPYAFDLLVVTHPECVPGIRRRVPELRAFRHDFLLRPSTSSDVERALFMKADVFDYEAIGRYRAALLLDVDIIVQGDLNRLFSEFRGRDGILHAPTEQNASHDSILWSLLRYGREDIERFCRRDIRPFNVGTMMFAVGPRMRRHHQRLRRLIADVVTRRSRRFYEQSVYNHCFNSALASDTSFLTRRVVLFPHADTYYSHATFVHFTGFGEHARKRRQMAAYLRLLARRQHPPCP